MADGPAKTQLAVSRLLSCRTLVMRTPGAGAGGSGKVIHGP